MGIFAVADSVVMDKGVVEDSVVGNEGISRAITGTPCHGFSRCGSPCELHKSGLALISANLMSRRAVNACGGL